MKFEEFNLNTGLLKGIEKAGFPECLDVQNQTFEHSLKPRDVYVQSQTGTGKTAAFLITIFELFLRRQFETTKALIIVPTRELAVQIEREARILGAFLSFRIGSFYGGVGYAEQTTMLKNGIDIIIGTPGRLIDLNRSHNLKFNDLSVLVIDEADRLFDMGFLPDLRKMLKKMPDRANRMTMLFSATLNTRVWQVAWEHMNDPAKIIINPKKMTVDEITQELYHVSKSEKLRLLLGLLARERPESSLIFSNTKIGAMEVSQRLSHNGYPCEFIIGDLPQRKRSRVIDGLKSGAIRCLVATDVAARGLHVNDLDLVVNYDIPEDPELYVHRIGRTARAGKSGKAISLACERFVYGLEAIEELIKMKIPVLWPDETLFEEDKSAGIHFGKERYAKPRQYRSDQRPHHRGHPVQGSRHPHNRPARPHEKVPGRPPQNTHRRPDPGQQAKNKPAPRPVPQKTPSPNRSAGMEDRLEYYKKKYGEDFRPAAREENAPPKQKDQDKSEEKKKSKSILKRLWKTKDTDPK